MNGSILDVNEIDAASNRKIDDVREIISDVKYVASTAKYTIYIIDEVHMLTTEAFNALLKTLEEPPEHVIFILATTEPQKVPQTILSRCQRFDFRRIRVDDIITRIREIAYGDGLTITDGAYKMLARLGDGSMRDALSVLERVVSACGTSISEDDIIETLGISAQENVFGILDAVLRNSPDDILKIIDDVLSSGRDLNTFADSVIKYVRDLLVCKVSSNPENILDYSSEDMVKLKAQCEKLTFEKINNAVSVLSSARADAKWVKTPRVIYELAFIRLAQPELDSTPEALMDKLRTMQTPQIPAVGGDISARLDAIEEKLKNGVLPQSAAIEEKPAQKKTEVSIKLFNPIPPSELNSANPVVVLAKKWDKLAASICSGAQYLKGFLTNRPVTIDADGLILLFKREEEFSKSLAIKYKDSLTKMFRKLSGSEFIIKVAFEDELEGRMIDFWSLPAPEGAVADASADENVSEDPLDALTAKFGDIVEMSDDSEFLTHTSEEDNFSQSSFEENDREEFFEDGELADPDNE